jgi:hypothetical protein
MRFKKIKSLGDAAFRRLTGVKRKTFDKMTELLACARAQKKLNGGKPNKLCIEDCLLKALEYLREYRTYFHISQSYGISESACYRNIVWVENTLVKDKAFALPGRKALIKNATSYEVILIDATESPIERPKKKTEKILFGQEETPYHQDSSGSR